MRISKVFLWAAIAFAGILGFLNTDAIAEKIVDQKLELSKIRKEFKKRDSELQLHLADVRGIRVQTDVLKRLTKLQRSARTEEQRAFVRSEEAKLRVLSAEHARIIKAAKEDLQKEITQ
jgi:Skp family chaperone for outer membrane proteins